MSTTQLESAIPEHLRQERTTSVKLSPDFDPPYPSYASRFPASINNIVMAIIGVQYPSKPNDDDTQTSKLSSFITSAPDSASPSFWELTSLTDTTGAYNVAIIAYWPSNAKYQEWNQLSGFGVWWRDLDAGSSSHGWFLEVFSPTANRLETVHSTTDRAEGVSHMRDRLSGAVKEHGYWGSMRDRLPIAQTDELAGEAKAHNINRMHEKTRDLSKSRIRVPGKKNLTVIRSGQDWSSTSPEERTLYLETMHPVLIKGMNFLRDSGDNIGCYSCRFMDVVDYKTGKADQERTFGLAYFDELASLERWSKSHKTHVNIFGGFLKYAKQLGDKMSLKLYHEVLVLEPEQQFFEYVGCHEKTGMLGVL